MRREKGFTLVELLAVIAIVGIMSATAMPLYRTFQQRAYGSEATTMMKRIMDAQIMYFLEKETFYPPDSTPIKIWHDDPADKEAILELREALNITIPVGHFLDYIIQNEPKGDPPTFKVTISSADQAFPLFKDGTRNLMGVLNTKGNVELMTF